MYKKRVDRTKKGVGYVVKEPTQLMDFLIDTLKGQSRNNIKSLLKYKEVLVDGVPISQFNYPLKVGQVIHINKYNDRYAEKKIALDILYEDDDLIVINKPAGLLSVSTGDMYQDTAYNLVMQHVRVYDPNSRIFIVHRLDRDTSGIIVFAKNEKIKLELQDNWAEIVSVRGYVAVVEGVLDKKEGRIESWLKETKTLLVYSSRQRGDGLHAITNYKVLEESKDYSLLEVFLETGRKNQIRVHMKELGNSIVGDKKYGSTKNPIKRLCLHANKLEFTHPVTKKQMKFRTKVPKGFSNLVKQL